MKISYPDRIQATKHSKLYQKDYQRYVEQREQDGEVDVKLGPPWDPRRIQSMAGKRLCEKWGLLFPVAPDAPLEPIDCGTMKPSADFPDWMIDGAVYPVSFPTGDELIKATQIAGFVGQKIFTHLNGKLCLLIDTSWPPDMIMDVLRKFIEQYTQETGERRGIPLEDPWEIYLMYQKGMNPLKITATLHGVSKQPAYNQESDYHYRRVRRAYSKAVKMIEYVEKEAKNRKRLPVKTPTKAS